MTYDLNGMNRPMTAEEVTDMLAKAPLPPQDESAERLDEIEAALIELAAMTTGEA